MTKLTIDPALGTPGEDVTHFGISRLTGQKRGTNGKMRPDYERETHPRPDGVRIAEWPIDELTLENVRERWGHGTFRAHWFVLDPSNPQPDHRRLSGGNGNVFTLDELDEEGDTTAAAPVPLTMPTFPTGSDMSSALGFATSLMTLADARTNATIEAVSRMAGRGGQDGGNAEVLARIAGLEAKIAADAERRTLEDAHRAELAKKDTEIAELKRKAEDAEREAERGGDAPLFEPGTPFTEQLAYAALNIATKRPELVMPIVGPIIERFMTKPGEAAAASTPVHAPPPTREAFPGGPQIEVRPRPVRIAPATPPGPIHIVRPAARPEPPLHVKPAAEAPADPMTPEVTAKAADPVAPPAEAAAAPS